MRQAALESRIATAVTLAVILAIVVLLAGGCTSYRPIRSQTRLTPSTSVQLWLSNPRSVSAVSASGDTTALGAVQELTGDVTGVSGDTLEVQVRSVNRRPPPHQAARVRIVPMEGDRVETRRVDAAATFGGFVLVFGLAVAALFLVASFIPLE